jgi:hypothetical protein
MLYDTTWTNVASVELVELVESVELVELVVLLSVAAFTMGTISNRKIILIIVNFPFIVPPFLNPDVIAFWQESSHNRVPGSFANPVISRSCIANICISIHQEYIILASRRES